MTGHALAWRSTVDTLRRFLFVATPAKIMVLTLQQWPHLRIGHVAIHTKGAARVVRVIVMAQYAVLGEMIEMRKAHRQNRFRTTIVMVTHRFFLGDR